MCAHAGMNKDIRLKRFQSKDRVWIDFNWFIYGPDAPITDGPFVPHNLISAQYSPVPLQKFQMALRLKILMSTESKKGTQIYYLFLSKSPGKRVPSSFPSGAPMERDDHIQSLT